MLGSHRFIYSPGAGRIPAEMVLIDNENTDDKRKLVGKEARESHSRFMMLPEGDLRAKAVRQAYEALKP